jgi:phosphotransferase system enzyme I (PtsP)
MAGDATKCRGKMESRGGRQHPERRGQVVKEREIRMDHVTFLCDVTELNWVFSDSTSVRSFLQKIAAMVGKHMHAAVCSIYLYDEHDSELTLHANVGLDIKASGPVRLRLDEGLTGLALEEMRPVCEKRASRHPRYKFFNGLNEERFDAFCAVPLLRGISRIGVLVIQRETLWPFNEEELVAMRAVANQLAAIIENARTLIGLEAGAHQRLNQPPAAGTFLRAKVASAGFAFAPVVIHQTDDEFESFQAAMTSPPRSLADFHMALQATERELEQMQRRIEEKLADGASLIFGAHLLLLKDRQFTGEMAGLIEKGENCVDAVIEIARRYMRLFAQQDSTILAEKRDDIKDLARRLLRHITHRDAEPGTQDPYILIARELLPSDILKLSMENVAGVVLVSGGVTSHLSILARSLRIPLMICDDFRLMSVTEGTPVLMDGDQAAVHIDPATAIVAAFRQREAARRLSALNAAAIVSPTTTADGAHVKLLSNINLLSDLDAALAMRTDGVGLYRTEFPFMIRSTFPTEEEQYVIYRRLDARMVGREVTFRTLDIGGDKVLSYYNEPRENNPFLGMRSIRFSLSRPDIFNEQIRAILRAGTSTDLRIMFPMVHSLEAFTQARAMVLAAQAELFATGIIHNGAPRIGMMVEIPSVLAQIDAFARLADFFSIGTNDLIQYVLAVDRTNEKVAGLYLPHHPAVLRAIQQVVSAALRHGKEVSICGDMAHEPAYLPFFIGIGVRSLSIDPPFIPAIQRAIAVLTVEGSQALAARILEADGIAEIERLLRIS